MSSSATDGAVLLDINKGICYSLNPVAALIWGTLESNEKGATLGHVIGSVRSHCVAPVEQLEMDVVDHLHELQRLGLVRCIGSCLV